MANTKKNADMCFFDISICHEIWNVINEMKIKKEIKNKLYLGVLIAINIVMGGVAWLWFGRLVLPGIDWLLCFMGYPAI
ncbi:MAG: hypothetical protein J6U54_23255, partial [Clostridiales bacterium]|nr:hypothetical protein [Clostridiales bacterium]